MTGSVYRLIALAILCSLGRPAQDANLPDEEWRSYGGSAANLWKPSLPLDHTWAFVWLSVATDRTAAFLWAVRRNARRAFAGPDHLDHRHRL